MNMGAVEMRCRTLETGYRGEANISGEDLLSLRDGVARSKV